MFCYNCNYDVPIKKRPWRQDTCPECNAYLHCCLNCRFYDPDAHNECREPQAKWVRDKEVGNFCDYFEASLERKSIDKNSRRDDARKKLDDLFKKQHVIKKMLGCVMGVMNFELANGRVLETL